MDCNSCADGVKKAVPCSTASKKYRRSLYNDTDEALAVDEPNFYSSVLGKANAFLIEYYATWCGDCQAFAPVFKKFSLKIKEWRNVIAVAHIDCAETKNVEICRTYEIELYPTLKLFPPNATEQTMGKTLFVGATNIDTVPIYKSMIDFVSKEVPNPPSSWPNMRSLSYSDWKGAWDATAAETNWMAVVVETDYSILGRDVILSTQHLRPFMRIERAIKGHAPFVDKNEAAVPFMVVAKRDGDPKTISDLGEAREAYIKHLEEMIQSQSGDHDINAGRVTRWPSISTVPTTIAPNTARCYTQNTVFADDFDNTVRNIFWQEMGRAKNITGDKLKALKAFLAVLVKYLPCNPKTKEFLSQATDWVQQQKTILFVADLTEFMKEVGRKVDFDLYPTPWIGCRGSETKFRGYPCSLWVTFHTISVAHYMDSKINTSVHHHEVLSAIRNYVINFFSCRGCAQHFKNMSANFRNEVTDTKKSVRWLWWGHNQVNARVKGSPSDDPKYPKIQFPPAVLCPDCPVSGDSPDGQWNEENVIEFLIKHYSTEIVGTAEPCDDTDASLPPEKLESLERR